MTVALTRSYKCEVPSTKHPFRIVEPFLDGFLRTEALLAALQLGVVDVLTTSSLSIDALAKSLQVDATHLRTLIGMLLQHDVLRQAGETLSLSDSFQEALKYRDLLEARLDFAHRVRASMSEYFALSIRDPRQYQNKLVNFYKFDTRPDYPESVAQMTRAFVRHMSTYTRYCAPVLLARHDFSRYRRLLDVGGNNGEVATQLCRKYPNLKVTILDIPAVCDIGIERVRNEGLSDRITYVKGDARVTPFPGGFDAVLFSSVLHDHDEATIALFLGKAHAALAPGGSLILFETYAFDYQHEPFAEHHVELIPFLAYYGPPDRYVAELTRLGFDNIHAEREDEIRYLLTTARRSKAKANVLEERLRAIVNAVGGREVNANAEELWFEVEAAAGVQIRLSGQSRGRWYDRSANFAICYSGQLSNGTSAAAFQAVVERIKAIDDSPVGGAGSDGFRAAAAAVAYPGNGEGSEPIDVDNGKTNAAGSARNGELEIHDRPAAMVATDSTQEPHAIVRPATTASAPVPDRTRPESAIFLDFCAQLFGSPEQVLLPMHWGFWPSDNAGTAADANPYGPWGAFSENLLAYVPDGLSRILDVGCGLGYNAKLLSERNNQVTALSPVAHHCAVIEAAKLPGVEVRCARFEQLVPDKPYDLLLFSESVNHFRLNDEFLAHCKRFLRGSGYMLMADDLSEESARFIETQTVFRIVRSIDITENVAPNIEWWGQQLPLLAAYRNALISTCALHDVELSARVRAAIDAVDNGELKFLLSGETTPAKSKGRYMIYLLQRD